MNEETLSSKEDELKKDEKGIDPEVWQAINLVNRSIWYPKADHEKVEIAIPFYIRKDVANFLYGLFRVLNVDPGAWFQHQLTVSIECLIRQLPALEIQGLDAIETELMQKLKLQDLG